MRPFKNVGWPHLEKVQMIIPAGASARGCHIFRLTSAHIQPPDIVDSTGTTPESPGNPTVIAGGAVEAPPLTSGSAAPAVEAVEASSQSIAAIAGSTITGSSGTDAGNLRRTAIGLMTDSGPSTTYSFSPSTSVITSKRTHSTMSAETSEVANSTATSSNPAPVNKKRQSLNMSSGSGMKASKRSGKVAAQASQAAAVMGMQGSINHLTNVFEESMRLSGDDTTMHRKDALRLLQEQEDNLLPIQKARMAALFQKDISAADTYVSLVDPPVREAWIDLMLKD